MKTSADLAPIWSGSSPAVQAMKTHFQYVAPSDCSVARLTLLSLGTALKETPDDASDGS
jgi:hypothetical protein